MSLPHPSSLPPGASTGALSRGVRRAAGVAARRPKTIIALWLLLVVGCVFAGGAAGTKTLSDTETGAGQSRTADERIEAAGLRDPAVESVLIRSKDARTSADAAADLVRHLKAGDDVSHRPGPGRRAGALHERRAHRARPGAPAR